MTDFVEFFVTKSYAQTPGEILDEWSASMLIRKIYKIGKGQQRAMVPGNFYTAFPHASTTAGGVWESQRLCRRWTVDLPGASIPAIWSGACCMCMTRGLIPHRRLPNIHVAYEDELDEGLKWA